MTIAPTGAAASYGLLGRLAANTMDVHDRLQKLTEQASSGRVSDSYAGLAGNGATALSLGPILAHHTATSNGIDAATGRMQVAQTALSQISDIASSFNASAINLNGLDASEIDSVAASARDALRQVAGLLDSKNGDTYVFAGQDSSNPPVPNPDAIVSSSFMANIQASVGGLGGAGLTATLAATMATATSNAAGVSPFSAAISTGGVARPLVQIADGQYVAAGIVAASNGDVASTGSSTTGSYMRDILRSLATLGSLDSSQAGTAGFGGLVGDVRSALGSAISALNVDAGVMGDRQTRLQAVKTQMDSVGTALQSQISSTVDVDMAATLSKLASVQTQLQASYSLVAAVQGLSLTKYLTAAA